MDKRVLLAVTLTVAVFFGYQILLDRMYPNRYDSLKKAPQAQSSPDSVAAPQPDGAAAATSASASIPQIQKVEPLQDELFHNDRINLWFNEKGGGIRKVSFTDYKDTETHEPVMLINQDVPYGTATYVEILRDGQPVSVEPADYKLSVHQTDVQATAMIDSIRVTKSYRMDPESFQGRLAVNLQNTGKTAAQLRYKLYAGGRVVMRHPVDMQFIEANFYPGEAGKENIKHIKESKLGKTIQSSHALQWLAVKDRHFSIILKPDTPSFQGVVEGLGDHKFQAALLSEMLVLAPGSSVTQEFTLYMGPNDIEYLEPLGLSEIVNFGKFDWISKLLLGMLELIHKVTRNYGIAIIILTLIINLLLSPITYRSYMSMKRMQLLQPQIKKLQAQHKNSPEKAHREMMELYKKHKVNPFGGCLPLLLQMPIFVALYVALCKAEFLVNAKFLWVKDLSVADSVPLPVSFPLIGDRLHILPVILFVVSIFQSRFLQVKVEGQDPAIEMNQKMMSFMMPALLVFMFYNMPSGYVLYFLINSAIMTLFQLHLRRHTL